MKKPPDTKPLYLAIHDIVRQVPPGRVTTYGAVAKAVGLTSGARMVARAMSVRGEGAAPFPAQRVVNSSGSLSGDNGHRKRLLEAEGVEIHNNRIIHFKTVFWDPLEEIAL